MKRRTFFERLIGAVGALWAGGRATAQPVIFRDPRPFGNHIIRTGVYEPRDVPIDAFLRPGEACDVMALTVHPHPIIRHPVMAVGMDGAFADYDDKDAG